MGPRLVCLFDFRLFFVTDTGRHVSPEKDRETDTSSSPSVLRLEQLKAS